MASSLLDWLLGWLTEGLAAVLRIIITVDILGLGCWCKWWGELVCGLTVRCRVFCMAVGEENGYLWK
jgi:hypothetical protein